jgi:hypothetical protein
MDSKRLRDLREAYGAIYEPEVELTEEQVWEEVESWVSSLLEEGYDLSDYTWEEMYEAYIEEQKGGIYATKPAPISNTPYQSRFARPRNANTTVRNSATGEVLQKPKIGGINDPRYRGQEQKLQSAARANAPQVIPTTSRSVPPAAGGSSGGSTAPKPATSAPARPSASPPAQKPTDGAARRTPTSVELKAAQKARTSAILDLKTKPEAEKAAVQAGINASKPAPARSGFGVSSAPIAAKASVANVTAPSSSSTPTPAAPVNRATGSKKPGSIVSDYQWGSTSKLVDGIANAYSSIYEAKKVDQDKDGDNDFADVRIARLIASGVPKAKAIAMVKDKSYNEEVEIDEATRMRKELGKEGETATRKELARRSNAYQRSGSVDRTIAAAERGAKNPYVARGKNETEAEHNQRKQKQSQTLTRLASNRRGSVRDKPRAGLRGYAAKVEGSDRDLQSARSSARSAGTLTPAEKKGLGEDFELWVNQLVEEGYDLSDYTWDEMYEIYEETAKEKEERIAARRARIKEMEAQGRVMTSTKRTRGAAAERKEAKRAEALERAANAILRQTTGSSGKVSDKPMGSVAPAPKEEAPKPNRERLKTWLRRDTLGTAADDALKGIKKEEYEIYEAILDYLLENNFADTQDNADIIIENMSEEWAYEILEGYKKLPVAKMIKQAAKKGQNTGPLTYTGNEDDYEKRVRQINKMARVASRHSTIKGKAKVRGEGQALLNKIRGEK